MVPLPERPAGRASASLLSRDRGGDLFRARSSSRYASVLHPPPRSIGWRARFASRSPMVRVSLVLLALFSIGCLSLSLSRPTRPDHADVPRGMSRADGQGRTDHKAPPPSPDYVPGTANLDHLVLVPSKAIWSGTSFAGHTHASNWIVDEFHKGDAVQTYWEQIKRGIELSNADRNALLVFSGGLSRTQGRKAVTEAASYLQLALESPVDLPVLPGVSPQESAHAPASVLAEGKKGLRSLRMTVEPYALDTLENLLFAIARFREVTNHYPQRITVVENQLYKERFEKLHVKALRWPHDIIDGHKRFNFVGVDEPGEMSSERYRSEMENEYRLFDKDMYGCHGPLLAQRQSRNPGRIPSPYHVSAPEITELLAWCPPDGVGLQGVYRPTLPWDPRVNDREGLADDKPVLPDEDTPHNWWPDNRWLVLSRERD